MHRFFWTFLLLAGLIAEIAGAAASAADAPSSQGVRIPVTFDATSSGLFSVALYDQNGVLVRSLHYAQPLEKGRQVIQWDGTDDLGRPVKPGVYTPKGISFTEPPSLKYVMKVGKSGNPPYRTADGKGDWGGNLGGPASLCANSKDLMLTWSCVEDNQITGIQQMDADGNISLRYFSFFPWDVRCASAMDDKNFYLGIAKLDEGLKIAAYTLGEPRGKIICSLPSKLPPMKSGRWKQRPMGFVDGLAITSDRIFATVGDDDSVYVIERSTGKILTSVTVNAPRGLAIVKDRLLVISGTQVLRLKLDGSADGAFVPDGTLGAPNAICVDPDGNVYVGDSGAGNARDPEAAGGHQQVFVFDVTGKLLRKLGKEGGTPRNGRYDANGFGEITSLCISPDGKKLFVNDIATGFQRTSRWSLDGKIEKEWFGRGDVGYVNPARPNELIGTGNFGADDPGIFAYEVDFATKQWKPAWHYQQKFEEMQQPPVFIGYEHGGSPFRQYQAGSLLAKGWPVLDYWGVRFVTFKGKNYFLTTEGAIYTYDGKSKPKLVGLVYMHRAQKEEDHINAYYDQGPNTFFTWADRNGDGRIAIDESTFTEGSAMLEKTSRMVSATIDDELNIILKRFRNVSPGHAEIIDSILPLKELLPNGAPVYDWSMLKDTAKLQMPDLNGGGGSKHVDAYFTGDNVVRGPSAYCLIEPTTEKQLKLPGIDGEGWWASRNWRKKIAKFDAASGKCLWAVGRRAPSVAQPGQMYNPVSLSGEAGGALFLADAMGVLWVWNTDGLYLGKLYHGPEDRKPDQDGLYIELQRSLIDVDPKSGKIYSIVTDNGASVHEVGLPKLQQVSGPSVNVSVEQVAQVKPWDPDGADPGTPPAYEATYTKAPIKIDGRLEEWGQTSGGERVPEMVVMHNEKILGKVKVMYDDQNLYLGYAVWAPNGPINAGSELPFAPFVSGAYVDFSVGPDWSKPQREQVLEGDARVILARVRNGASGETDYQQGFWPIRKGGESPQTIKSPAASVHFDQVKPVPGLKSAIHSEAKEPDGVIFYEVEVSVPLSSLGLTNPAGKRIGFDASIGIANIAGDRRDFASHWAGQSEATVVDRPGSARLLPATWGTLSFRTSSTAKTVPK